MAPRLVILVAALFALICVLAVGRRNSSSLLIALFVLWVFLPFAVLALLVKASGRWSARRQSLLKVLNLAICAVAACVYGVVAFVAPTAKPAFWFLILPGLSLGAIAVTGVAALREKSDRGP